MAITPASGSQPAGTTSPTTRLQWIGVAISGLLVLIVAGLFLWGRSVAPPSAGSELKPVPLTSMTSNSIAEQASFSPDGNQVVFTWNGEARDNADVYIQSVGVQSAGVQSAGVNPVGSGAPLRLTTDQAPDYAPKWSPDGQKIAFLRGTTPGRVTIFLVPPLGGAERKVAQLFERRGDETLSWTPDSKWLVTSGSQTEDESERLLAVSLETGEIRPLTNPPPQGDDEQPALAPNGRMLAFVRWAVANASLEVLLLSEHLDPGGDPRELRTGSRVVRNPAWTADGRDLVYATDLGTGQPSLARIAVTGGRPSPLSWAHGFVSQPAVAPRGRRLVYTRTFQDTNIWRIALDDKGGGKAPVPEKVIASPFAEKFPQYSPDGKRIAFDSDRSGTEQIWTCLADGSQCSQATNMTGGAAGFARWSPDGRQLVFEFVFGSGVDSRIYAVSADGGKPRPLTNGTSINVFPSWSQDGKWVYFGSGGDDPQIWKVPSRGGAAVQVTHTGGSVAVESPDGKTLYFTFAGYDGPPGLWKMAVDGGPETRVVAQRTEGLNFAVTEQGIYFTPSHLKEDGSSIQFLNFATNTIQEIAKIDKRIDLGLAISADRKSLLLAQGDYAGSNLMLVEGFR
jgi:Tol biopolymer transport system component